MASPILAQSSNSSSEYEWLTPGRTLNNERYINTTINLTQYNLSWSEQFSTDTDDTNFVSKNGIIYVGTMYGTNGYLLAVNRTTGIQIWNKSTATTSPEDISIAGDVAYIRGSSSCGDPELFAINLTSQNMIWNYSSSKNLEGIPIISNNILYIGGSHFVSAANFYNAIYAINISNGNFIENKSFEHINNSGQPVNFETVTIAENKIFVETNGGGLTSVAFTRIGVLNQSNISQELWNYSMGPWEISESYVKDDIVIFASEDGSSSSKTIFALNATNGTQIWNRTISGAITWPSVSVTSPRVYNNTLYIGDNANHLFAINFTNGTELWNKTYSKDITVEIITKNMLFVTMDSNMVAYLNLSNGNMLWNYSGMDDDVGYVMPIIINNTVYIVDDYSGGVGGKMYALGFVLDTDNDGIKDTLDNCVTVYNPAQSDNDADGTGDSCEEVTGPSTTTSVSEWVMYGRTLNNTRYYHGNGPTEFSKEWEFDTGDTIISTPAVKNGKIYFGDLNNNLTYSVDITTGNQIATYAVSGKVLNSPTVVNDTLFVISDSASATGNDTLFSFYIPTGNQKWNFTLGDCDNLGGPVVKDEKVYIGCKDVDLLYAINSTDSTLVWNVSVNAAGGPAEQVAVEGNYVYVSDKNDKLWAFNATNGNHIWNYSFGMVVSAPIIVDEMIIVGATNNNYVFAINATNGSQVWNYSGTNTFSRMGAAYYDERVYLGCNDNKIYSLNSTNGSLLWTANASGQTSGTLAIANNAVYVSTDANLTFAFNRLTGAQLDNYSTVATTNASPIIVDGKVYIANQDGKLYALEQKVTTPASSNSGGSSKGDKELSYVNSEICIQGWICEEWSECINGKLTRTCFKDNDCEKSSEKPSELKDCVVEQQETVDKTITKPDVQEEKQNDLILDEEASYWKLIILIMGIILLLVGVFYLLKNK